MVDFFDIPGGPELPAAGSGSGSGGGSDDKLPLDGSSAMTGGLELASLDPSAAPNESLFFEDVGGRPTWKDSSGTTWDLAEGSTGTLPPP